MINQNLTKIGVYKYIENVECPVNKYKSTMENNPLTMTIHELIKHWKKIESNLYKNKKKIKYKTTLHKKM